MPKLKGAPLGNKNATKNKPWEDAIRRALARYENDKVKQGDAINKAAEAVVIHAMLGNQHAWKEIGDRLDGKPHQTLSADVDASVTVEVVRFAK